MAAEFMHMDATGYEIAYKHFVSELKTFHEARNGPFRGRPPTLGGRQIDLYYLYQKVTSIGGQSAVTAKGRWEEVVRCFDLPPSCTNAVYAVQQNYSRFLEDYERIHFLGEDEVEASRFGDSGSVQTAGDGDSAVRHNIRASFPDRRISSVSRPTPVPVPAALPLGSADVQFHHLRLALRCGLANEAELALNACLIISHKTPGKLMFSEMTDLLSLLLAHAGFYHPDLLPEVEQGWNYTHCDQLADMWNATVSEPGASMIRTTRLYSDPAAFSSLGPVRDVKWAVDRAALVCTVLLNLADHGPNAQHLASSELFCCFSTMLLCCAVSAIRHLGEEIAVACGGHFLLETSSQVASLSVSSPTPFAAMSPPKRCATTRRVWQGVVFDLLLSKDKASVLNGLAVIAAFCKANGDSAMAVLLPAPCLKQLFSYLSAVDVQLMISSLEALLSLSSLGKCSATLLCSCHRGIAQLMALLTLDVESTMPPHSLQCIRLTSESVPARLLQRNDANGIALAWLAAFYERKADNTCSRNQIYNEYAMHCAMKIQPAVAILQPAAFWRCLSTCYPGLHAVGLALPGSITIADMHLRGLVRRSASLPLHLAPPAAGVQIASSVIVPPGQKLGPAAAGRQPWSVQTSQPANNRGAASNAVQRPSATSSKSPAVASKASPAVSTAARITAPSSGTTGSISSGSLGMLSASWMQQQVSAVSAAAAAALQGQSPLAASSPVGEKAALHAVHSAVARTGKATDSQPTTGRPASASTLGKPGSGTVGAVGTIATSNLVQLYQQQQQERLAKVSQAIAASVSAVAPTTNARIAGQNHDAPAAPAAPKTVGQVTQAASTSASRPLPSSAAVAAALQSRVAQVASAAGIQSSINTVNSSISSSSPAPSSAPSPSSHTMVKPSRPATANTASTAVASAPRESSQSSLNAEKPAPAAGNSAPSTGNSVSNDTARSWAVSRFASLPGVAVTSSSAVSGSQAISLGSSTSSAVRLPGPVASSGSVSTAARAESPALMESTCTSSTAATRSVTTSVCTAATATGTPSSSLVDHASHPVSAAAEICSSVKPIPAVSNSSSSALKVSSGSAFSAVNGIASPSAACPSPRSSSCSEVSSQHFGSSAGKTLAVSSGTHANSPLPCKEEATHVSALEFPLPLKRTVTSDPDDSPTPAPAKRCCNDSPVVTDGQVGSLALASTSSRIRVAEKVEGLLATPSPVTAGKAVNGDVIVAMAILSKSLDAMEDVKKSPRRNGIQTSPGHSPVPPNVQSDPKAGISDKQPPSQSALAPVPPTSGGVPVVESEVPHSTREAVPMDIDEPEESLCVASVPEDTAMDTSSSTAVQAEDKECGDAVRSESPVSFSHQCHWTSCQFGCEELVDLYRHIVSVHAATSCAGDASHQPSKCQWIGCKSDLVRHPTNLLAHVAEHVLALDGKTHPSSSLGVRSIQDWRLEAPSPPPQPATEYALSGTVHITAALVLLNLIRHAPARYLRPHRFEEHLLQLSSLVSEAAPTLAKCLAELPRRTD